MGGRGRAEASRRFFRLPFGFATLKGYRIEGILLANSKEAHGRLVCSLLCQLAGGLGFSDPPVDQASIVKDCFGPGIHCWNCPESAFVFRERRP